MLKLVVDMRPLNRWDSIINSAHPEMCFSITKLRKLSTLFSHNDTITIVELSPFHQMQVMNPHISVSGYGSLRASDSGLFLCINKIMKKKVANSRIKGSGKCREKFRDAQFQCNGEKHHKCSQQQGIGYHTTFLKNTLNIKSAKH